MHKSCVNSLAELERWTGGGGVERYSSVTLFVLIGVKLQAQSREREGRGEAETALSRAQLCDKFLRE